MENIATTCFNDQQVVFKFFLTREMVKQHLTDFGIEPTEENVSKFIDKELDDSSKESWRSTFNFEFGSAVREVFRR